MLNCGCPGSIRLRFTSTEQSSFFFQPVELHLELTDLLVEFALQVCVCSLLPLPTIRKCLSQVVQSLLLPLRHLRRVHPVMCRNLVDRSYSLYRFQRHLTLEGRLVLLPWFG